MYPFWNSIVEPLVRASDANRIVEIGALRGETTALMLDDLGPDAELHVIDPVPEFDPSEHEARFGGRYVFHRDLSLNVLDSIGAVDVALVDGDHNWYTVIGELRSLAAASQREARMLPLIIMHDVCWPYGRRDLYYDPSNIPAEGLQPYRKGGMRLGQKELARAGGMNAQLDNAIIEGGPRNGVMTALDDFVAEHPDPLRVIVLPIYFGLAIVASHERLAATPRLVELLDQIESPEGKDHLLRLGEKIRLGAAIFEQNVTAHKDRLLERGVRRYLEVVKHALVGDLDVDNEIRVEYLKGCAERGNPPAPHCVRDPVRFLQRNHVELQAARETGRPLGGDGEAGYAYASMGRTRLQHLEQVLDAVRTEKVPGHLVEAATGRGGGAIFMRAFLEAHEDKGRGVWVADPFRYEVAGSDLNQVREGFARFDLLDDRVHLVQGDYPGTFPLDGVDRIAVLRIGLGAGADVGLILDRSYDLVSDGGFVIVDGADDPVVREALDRFRAERGIVALEERVDWWSVAWRRDPANEGPATTPTGPAPDELRARAPLAPPAPADALDLSVIVVFHNMAREAARTLHSLSRAYQRDIDDLRYEVLAFDNGSSPDQRLDAAFVAGFGPEFRLIDLGPDAPGTPTVALNEGIRQARGKNFVLMIDGAHVLSPGVLHHGMTGLRAYEPAVVATQQWYVGPGQQPDTVRIGYDQGVEDALFEQIDWPADGYRLFEIGHIVGERDWFDGMIESNCLFVPRSIVEQVGGFDDAFSMPGGGYTNLEVYERLSAAPDASVVTIVGEASFHQVHGGITTNDTDVEDRRNKTFAYGEHYQELRGRMLRGPAGFMHYVGAFTHGASRRTRSRRLTTDVFAKAGASTAMGAEGMPTTPEIIPDELRLGFIEAFWRSLSWQRSTWMGRKLATIPTDLQVMQELVWELRPDWIIETGTDQGGRALFLAGLLDALDHGQLLSVDPHQPDDLPAHPRIQYLKARAEDPEVAAQVHDLVGHTENALVVLGARTGMRRVMREFDHLSGHVPVGGYVIVEQTVVNGNPVWPEHGLGPGDAVRQLLQVRGDFVADPFRERFGLTFDLGGYLKRVKPNDA
jgi:cephalosporin hydroxylase